MPKKSIKKAEAEAEELFFTAEELEADSTLSLLSGLWQDPSGIANVYVGQSSDLLTGMLRTADGSKPSEPFFRQIQKKCWEKYRTFGPINASVNSKADYTTGKGFSVYSDVFQIDRFLHDLYYSRRNRLYATSNSWLIRMQAEGELFLLLVFDKNGTATVRVLEPDNIGDSDEGLIIDPDDATQSLFYKHKTKDDYEIIPDINILFNPSLEKKLKDDEGNYVQNFDKEKTVKSRKNGYKKIGGYYRYVLHWKNLTGLYEYKRDTSSLMTVIEAITLYWNAIKWELDHKKAQTSWTMFIEFTDSPTGRIAAHKWNKLTDAEKDATGLTKNLTPGSRVFMPPGMTGEIKSPQLTKLEGENADLLNIAGAGARTPQDLMQGQSSGSTHASLRSSRPPLEMEIGNNDHKFGNFLKWEFLRACFYVKSRLSEFPETFKKRFVVSRSNGKPKIEERDVEPVELVKCTFPVVRFEDRPDKRANMSLGSKHNGLEGMGVSHDTLAKNMGIDDLGREKDKRALDEAEFGKEEMIRPDQNPPGKKVTAEQ